MTLNSSALLCPVVLICSAGAYAADNYHVDSGILPAEWRTPDSIAGAGIRPDDSWWMSFNDSLLDSLIRRGREANYDLAIAGRRIAIARARLGQSRAAYMPTLGLNAGYTRERSSGRMTAANLAPTTDSYFSGSVTMSWEIDVFGKITAQVRQNKAQVAVSAAEYAAAVNALDAEIANTYIKLLASRAQLEVARRHSRSQEHIVSTTEERFEAGLASKLDLAQARTLYYSTIASIPQLEAGIEATVNSLAVLLGVEASGLPSEILEAHPLPDCRQLVAMGQPADMLRRRPDIIEAERNIDVAAAALGVARSEYLPSLSLQASVGTAANDIKDLFGHNSLTYSITPTLSWTIFDGLGRRYANAEAAENLHLAVDSYNLAVLNAVSEVRTAAERYMAGLQYIDRIERVVDNASESTTLAFDLYRQGLTPFTNVDNAELNFLAYENTLVEAHSQAITALIDLYKALGFGANFVEH